MSDTMSLPNGEWKESKLGDAPLSIIDGDRGKNYPKNDKLFAVTLRLKLEKRRRKLRWFKTHERSLSYDAKEIFS